MSSKAPASSQVPTPENRVFIRQLLARALGAKTLQSVASVAPSLLSFLIRLGNFAIAASYSPAEMEILERQIHAVVNTQMPPTRFVDAIAANLKIEEKDKAVLPTQLTRHIENFWRDLEIVKQNGLDSEKENGVINIEERRV